MEPEKEAEKIIDSHFKKYEILLNGQKNESLTPYPSGKVPDQQTEKISDQQKTLYDTTCQQLKEVAKGLPLTAPSRKEFYDHIEKYSNGAFRKDDLERHSKEPDKEIANYPSGVLAQNFYHSFDVLDGQKDDKSLEQQKDIETHQQEKEASIPPKGYLAQHFYEATNPYRGGDDSISKTKERELEPEK